MEIRNGKTIITGNDICLIVGIIMALAGVYWMWISKSEDASTTACCCFCAAAVLLFNRIRKKRSS